MIRAAGLALLFLTLTAGSGAGQIERVWLTHRRADPDRIVVNWTSATPGVAVVEFGLTAAYGSESRAAGLATLHHVEIPTPERDAVYHYRVRTGGQVSADASFKAYPTSELRIAVVANWQGRPELPGLVADDVHLLLTAGDHISSLHGDCGVGITDCVAPYASLIDRYAALFRSTPFLPVLGNHDREIRPRGPQPPPEPVYDVAATAYRRFFELPDEEWRWRFDVPQFGLRLLALDLSHISDQGTTWQTCHPFGVESEQFDWYRRQIAAAVPFTITLYNERHASVRGQTDGAWHAMIGRGTAAITGFGYFAERALVDGFAYYNTSLNGRGDRYPDPRSQFLASEDSYVLITLRRDPKRMEIALKALDGRILDRQEYRPTETP